MQNSKFLLVDTSIILHEDNVLFNLFINGYVPIVSNTVLKELDYNKTEPGKTGYIARSAVKYIAGNGGITVTDIDELPNGIKRKTAIKFQKQQTIACFLFLGIIKINSKTTTARLLKLPATMS